MPRFAARLSLRRLSAAPPGALAVACAVFLMVFYFWSLSADQRYGGDLTGHFCVGRLFAQKTGGQLPAKVHQGRGDGFDGQFFLYLAWDPLLRHRETRLRLDDAFLRARRIGYPLLVSAVALGKDGAVAWVMFLVCAGAVAGVAYRVRQGWPAGWSGAALALAAALGWPMIMSYQWMTCEALAMALVAGSIVAYRRQRWAAAWVLAALAILTKEIAGLWPMAVMLHAALRGQWRRVGAAGLTCTPLLAWMAYLHWGVGLPCQPGSDLKNLSWPLVGALGRVRELTVGPTAWKNLYRVADLVMVVAVTLSPVLALVRLRRDRSEEALALVLASVLAVSLPAAWEWWAWNNYTRQTCLVYLFSLMLVSRGQRWRDPSTVFLALSLAAGVLYLGAYF